MPERVELREDPKAVADSDGRADNNDTQQAYASFFAAADAFTGGNLPFAQEIIRAYIRNQSKAPEKAKS